MLGVVGGACASSASWSYRQERNSVPLEKQCGLSKKSSIPPAPAIFLKTWNLFLLCTRACVTAGTGVQQAEDNSQTSVLFFHAGSRAQGVRLAQQAVLPGNPPHWHDGILFGGNARCLFFPCPIQIPVLRYLLLAWDKTNYNKVI